MSDKVTVKVVRENRGVIEHMVGNIHVCTTSRVLIRTFRDRIKSFNYTRAARKEVYRTALRQHEKNFIMYAAIMSGKL